MSMHGGGGGGGGGRMGLRSMRQNRDILEHQIKKGTLPRMLTYARQYRPLLVVFLVAVVLDAVVSSVTPLLFAAIIDIGIKHKHEGLVIGLALVGAGLALFDAVLSLFERRTSAVIGEGLIYDLRTKVFTHIQEMPVAFFSRTQTGALISRLNNDVIGAQQAFTDLFSNVVGNMILVTIVIGTMLVLSWQITIVALLLLPVFLIPARRVGRKLGTLVALTLYLTRLYGPLTQLSNLNIDYMSAMVSCERLFEVLDLEPMIKESPDAVVMPDGAAELIFDHVDFSYPGAEEVSLASLEAVARLDDTPRTDVLHDVSFRVEPGTMTALVGHSGAGKTTISMLVSRLYDVDRGGVTINGVDVRHATTASLNAMVGVVTQDPHLFHDTLRTNLIFARPAATPGEIEGALRAAQIWELVQSLPLGLETVVGERGYRLSGGEKQRVALARLLLKAPRLVVLDETMSSRTSLVIAHRLSTIRNADQILVVENGTIVQRGTHAQLFAEGGVYRVLYETQFADQED